MKKMSNNKKGIKRRTERSYRYAHSFSVMSDDRNKIDRLSSSFLLSEERSELSVGNKYSGLISWSLSIVFVFVDD